MTARVLKARRLLLAPDRFIEDGGLLVRRGRVVRVLTSSAAVRRAGAPVLELPDGTATPGLVNAHAHLELSGLAGLLPSDAGFAAWVRALLARRGALAPLELVRAAETGAARLLATGCTTVGDVDSTGAGLAAARGRGPRPRTLVYREVLDAWDPARTAGALGSVRRALRARDDLWEGVSPHAPFTTSPKLLAGAARVARSRRLAVAVHWSESEDEVGWLRRGSGPLASVLPGSPRRAGLDLLHEAGLLGPRTALIHGNLPERGEAARIARAGASVVHCPGTHAFFARPPFPLARYRRAGVELALGTDSLASNADLDLRRELALFSAAHPDLPPRAAWRAATEGAARALGLAGQVGCLTPGAFADVAVFDLRPRTLRSGLEALTLARPAVVATLRDGSVTAPPSVD